MVFIILIIKIGIMLIGIFNVHVIDLFFKFLNSSLLFLYRFLKIFYHLKQFVIIVYENSSFLSIKVNP